MHSSEIAFNDRLISAFIAAFFMALTVIAVPVIVLVVSRGRGWEFLGFFGQFHVWAITIITSATITGFCLGSEKTTSLFGHLWGTERPRNIVVTLGLWASLAFLAFVSHLLSGKNVL